MLSLMVSTDFCTSRLAAHPIGPTDFAVWRAFLTDPGTIKTLSADGFIPSEEMSREIFHRHLRHWEEHQFGVWLFSTPPADNVVGYCGLRRQTSLAPDEIELLYGLRSPFFRLGFWMEMARAVVALGFREIRPRSIVGFTSDDNVASRALMTKLGMEYEGVVEHAGLPHLRYRLRSSGD